MSLPPRGGGTGAVRFAWGKSDKVKTEYNCSATWDFVCAMMALISKFVKIWRGHPTVVLGLAG